MILLFRKFLFFFIIPVFFMKFLLNRSHFLLRLLILEVLSLSLYFILCVNIFGIYFELVFILYFLIILVCEGVLGLCLLVVVNYRYGSDYLFLINKLIC